MILEVILVEKVPHLTASFNGQILPYVRCVVARKFNPDIQSSARVIGVEDFPQGVGDEIRLNVLRTTTDRKTATVCFDCALEPDMK